MSRYLLPVLTLAVLLLPVLCLAAYDGTAMLTGTTDLDSYGTAIIHIDNSNLMTLTLEIFNLDPNTCHASHIHSGTCQMQGGVYIGLLDICVDGTGHGTQTTVVMLTPAQVASIMNDPHYVNVHHQTTGAGTTCGNIVSLPTATLPSSWGQVKALYH
jgi:hypothetical protein